MESPWKVITAFVGVFVAGSVFGGLLTLRVIRQREVQTRMVQFVPAPEMTPNTPASSATVAASAGVTSPTAVTPSSPSGPVATGAPAAAPTVTPPPVRPAVAQIQALPASMVGQAPGLMRRHVEKLDLTPEQKERVLLLITRAGKDLTRQQQTNFRETGVILQHLQEDVSRELTPIQRTRLDEMIERQRLAVEQRQREEQEAYKKFQADKAERRAQKQAPKDNPIKPKGKPPEDGNN